MHHPHTHMYAHTRAHIRTCIHIQDGYITIDIAASNGHEDVVQLLLDLKGDPDLTDKEISTCVAASKVATAYILWVV